MLDGGVDRVNQIGHDFTRILFMTIQSGEKKVGDTWMLRGPFN